MRFDLQSGLFPHYGPSIFSWTSNTTSSTRKPPKDRSVCDVPECTDNETPFQEMVEKGPDVEMCVDISTPRSADKSTQTDFTAFYTANSDDHSYSVSFTKTLSSEEQSKAMQELLEEKEIMLNKLKEQLGQMKKKLDQYKEQEFTLEKIKDDDSAIQFY